MKQDLGIRNLTIKRLAKVTLIAGANGAGKTRVLKAAAKAARTARTPERNASDTADGVPPQTWIDASGPDAATLTKWWDKAGLTGEQPHVIEAVRTMVDDIENISLISPDWEPRLIPVATLKGKTRRIPLRDLGSGTMQFFMIALALANTRDGLLLIEAPDAGIHYLALATLWPMILNGANRNNVQVIATTYSTDSIYGLAVGSREHDDDAAYVRLDRRGDEVHAVEYVMETLRVAEAQNIAIM